MVSVRPARESDRAGWESLYRAYAGFYATDQTAEQRELVWGWIHDPDHPVRALLAVTADDRPVAFAHYREFPRPLAGTTGGYLDDLFVHPEHRGSGVGDALLDALTDIGAHCGWDLIRWITAADNARARALYDRRAVATQWVTYDLPLNVGHRSK